MLASIRKSRTPAVVLLESGEGPHFHRHSSLVPSFSNVHDNCKTQLSLTQLLFYGLSKFSIISNRNAVSTIQIFFFFFFLNTNIIFPRFLNDQTDIKKNCNLLFCGRHRRRRTRKPNRAAETLGTALPRRCNQKRVDPTGRLALGPRLPMLQIPKR